MPRKVNTLKKKSQITMFIILGIVILSLFGFMYYIMQQRAESKIEAQARQVYSKLSEEAFTVYVESCLDDVLEDSLRILGKQGGYFFESQPGYTFGQGYIIHNTDYNGDKIAYLIYHEPIDYYPCRPALNPSVQYAPDFCRYSLGNAGLFFGNSQMLTLVPLKRQLEKYIEEKIQECANTTWITEHYQDFKGYDFIVNQSRIKADIRFQANSVRVKLDYPITLKIGGIEPIMEFLYFTADTNIRFKKIYESLVKEYIVKRDITEPLFPADENQIKSYISGARLGNINIIIEKSDGDTIFIINDSDSSYKSGENYVFQFARQNRPPALDYVHQREHPQDYPDLYDFLVIEGEQINLSPSARDPDEEDSFYFVQDLPSSTGWHNITVKAFDSHNLEDTQKVRLLIDRKITPEFQFYTYYPEFPDIVSLEDPVFLNASSLTNTSLDPYANYAFRWTFQHSYGAFYQETINFPPKSELWIPSDFDINNIKSKITENYFKNPSPYYHVDFKASINYPNYVQEQLATHMINVTECIPHKSSFPPYPYNNLENAFLGDHSCCTANFTFAGNNTPCHIESTGTKFCIGTMLWTSKAKVRYCSGDRGNICSGEEKEVLQNISTGLCGYTSCGVNSKCTEKHPFALTTAGFCYGSTGCESFCKDELIDINQNGIRDSEDGCKCQQKYENENCIDYKTGIKGKCTKIQSFWGASYKCQQ